MNYIISYIMIYFSFNLYCIDVLFKFNYTYIIILGCNSDNEVWNCIWLYTNYSNSFTTNSILIHKGNKIYYLLDIYRDEISHGYTNSIIHFSPYRISWLRFFLLLLFFGQFWLQSFFFWGSIIWLQFKEIGIAIPPTKWALILSQPRHAYIPN